MSLEKRCRRCGGPFVRDRQLDGEAEVRCLLCSREPGDPHPPSLSDAALAAEQRTEAWQIAGVTVR